MFTSIKKSTAVLVYEKEKKTNNKIFVFFFITNLFVHVLTRRYHTIFVGYSCPSRRRFTGPMMSKLAHVFTVNTIKPLRPRKSTGTLSLYGEDVTTPSF